MLRALDTTSVALLGQYQRFARSAMRVATQDPPPDLVHETVEQIATATDARADLAVIKTADHMLGSLIDIWA